jgi:hypothetical protein
MTKMAKNELQNIDTSIYPGDMPEKEDMSSKSGACS